MFQQWVKSLNRPRQSSDEKDIYWIERLTAVLLVEVARADSNVDTEELTAIGQAITASSSTINAEELDEIVSNAREDADTTISFHEHLREINAGFSRTQKLHLIEQMWRVAYADGDLDKYEEYTIRKMADLLFVEHQEFIRAKLKVLSDI